MDLSHLQLRVCWESEVPQRHSSSARTQPLPSICSHLQQAAGQAETLPVWYRTQGKGETAWEWRVCCPKQQQCSVCIFNSFFKVWGCDFQFKHPLSYNKTLLRIVKAFEYCIYIHACVFIYTHTHTFFNLKLFNSTFLAWAAHCWLEAEELTHQAHVLTVRSRF